MSFFKFINKLFSFRIAGVYNKLANMENDVAKTSLTACLQVLPEKRLTDFDKTSDTGVNTQIGVESTEVNGNKREFDHSSDNAEEAANKKAKFESLSIKRKKVALLLSYCGHGYIGMQRNKGVKTIEEDLFTALLKVGLITQDHYDLPQSINFQRAARTDKGVSAARQVVSLRIVLGDDLKEKINDHLPPCIRVQSIIRTTKGFNSKFWCDARTYSYTLPTFAFAPVTEITNEDYRVNESVIEQVNEILNRFKGTHNFHNFTSGKKFDDASAKRYIMNFQCGKPFIEDGLEIVVIKVKGQSFMLHQIRKMIGITIAIMRGMVSIPVLEKAFESARVDIPIAPGLGLVLEEVHYEKYNKRYSKDGFHEPLLWDNIKDEIEEFKRKYIYLTIIQTEIESKSLINWLATLPMHTYDVREPSAPDVQMNTAIGLAAKLVVKSSPNSVAEATHAS